LRAARLPFPDIARITYAFKDHGMPLRALILLLALAGSALAQSPASARPGSDSAERVKALFAAYDHTDTAGCAVGVSVSGRQVLREAWGMADLEHHVALTPDTVFEAGSVSKQFTAAAILLLAEQGKLSLSDPVRKYFPELPDYGTPITIEHLLHHTSGLRDWGSVAQVAGWPRKTRSYSNASVLDIAARQKSLNYKPGDAWSYTNTGYNLLAILVQRVSGKSLAQFTRDNIFLPLDMTHTSWRDDFRRIVPDRAIAYENSDSGLHQLMPFENAYGNGGLLTTVGDLLRWSERFAGSKIGDASFVQSELDQARLNDGRTLFYAAGLFITEHDGLREISHSGATAGYRSWLGYYPGRQISVALLCNTAGAQTTILAHQVADIYLFPSGTPVVPAYTGTLPPDAEGAYVSRRDHSALPIERKDGKLIANGQTPLIPLTPGSFRLSPEGGVYELTKDAAGKVTGLRQVSMGYESDAFDKVPRVTPTPSELQPMVGDYVSDEAEATLSVVLTSSGLEIHERPDIVYPLKPAYADGFSSELGSVRFERDPSGRVTGMILGDSRMWDLRLRRVQTH
jgi:CubicO group peptidase (beta-lactamase class C family)